MSAPDEDPHRIRASLFGQALAVGLPVAAAALSGSVASKANIATWYAGLEKPSFTPPNGVFGPVWTVIDATMAYAAWRIISLPRSTPQRSPALAWFYIQLALNAAWSWAFFGWHSPVAGAGTIVMMLAAILATINLFWRVDRIAGAVLVPYAFWVGYATYLNFGIWRLN